MGPDNSHEGQGHLLYFDDSYQPTQQMISRRRALGLAAALGLGATAGAITDRLGIFDKLFPRPKAQPISEQELEPAMEYARRVEAGTEDVDSALAAIYGPMDWTNFHDEKLLGMKKALDSVGFRLFQRTPFPDQTIAYRDLSAAAEPYLNKATAPDRYRLYFALQPFAVANAFALREPRSNSAGRALWTLSSMIANGASATSNYMQDKYGAFHTITPDDQRNIDRLLKAGLEQGLTQMNLSLRIDASKNASHQWVDAAYQLMDIAAENNSISSSNL